MKKAISLLLMILMVVSIIPFALAEDNQTNSEDQTSDQEDDLDDQDDSTELEEEIENVETGEADTEEETQNQIQSMNTGLGSEVRLLQLEKAIARNILRGQEVIAEIESKGNDTSALEDIISDMGDLKVRVQALNPESENATAEFVDIKSEAIDLSKQFREEAKTLLNKSDADALRTRLKEMNRSELTELNNQIRNRVREYNAEQLTQIFEVLGIENEELLSNFENGNATLKEVRELIKTEFKSMTQEEKKSTFSALKEAGVKRIVTAKSVIAKAKQKINETKSRISEKINEKIGKNGTESKDETETEDESETEVEEESEGNSSNGRRGGNQ